MEQLEKLKSSQRNSNGVNFPQKNLLLVSAWHALSPTLRAEIQQKHAMNRDSAQGRRSIEQLDQFKLNIYKANKWNIIKTRKNEMLTELNYLRKCALRQRSYRVLMVLHLSLKRLLEKYVDLRQERIRAIRRMFAALMCVRKFKRRINKKGPEIDIRTVRDM